MNVSTRSYHFTANTYQASVLLQYNKHASLSLLELETSTLLPNDFLREVVQSLISAGLLVEKSSVWYEINDSEYISYDVAEW